MAIVAIGRNEGERLKLCLRARRSGVRADRGVHRLRFGGRQRGVCAHAWAAASSSSTHRGPSARRGRGMRASPASWSTRRTLPLCSLSMATASWMKAGSNRPRARSKKNRMWAWCADAFARFTRKQASSIACATWNGSSRRARCAPQADASWRAPARFRRWAGSGPM